MNWKAACFSVRNALPAFFFGAAILLSDRLDWWALEHVPAFVGVAFLILGAIVAAWDAGVFGKVAAEKFTVAAPARVARARGPILLISAAAPVAAFAVFYLLRPRLFAYPPRGLGDSALLFDTLPLYSLLFGYLDSFDELLTLFIASKTYLFTNAAWGLDVARAMALVSSAAGAAYVLLVIMFLRDRPARDIVFGVIVLLLSPAIQTYCGYIENYALPFLYISALLMAAFRRLEIPPRGAPDTRDARDASRLKLSEGAFLACLGTLAAWAALHHLITATLAPALALFVWLRARQPGRPRASVFPFLRGVFQAVPPALALLFVTWGLFFFVMEPPVGLGESHLSSPPLLHPKRWFAIKHLRDLLNLSLLGAPLALAVLCMIPAERLRAAETSRPNAGVAPNGRLESLRRIFARDDLEFFLLTAFLCMLAAVFILNPMLGFPADWDVFSVFQIPLNLYALKWLFSTRGERTSAPRIVVLFALGIGLTAPWIARNAASDPESRHFLQSSTERVRELHASISHDPLYVSLKTTERKRLFVKGRLFFHNRRADLDRANKHSAPEDLTRAREMLARAETDFFAVIGADDARFTREFPLIFTRLEALNTLVLALRAEAEKKTTRCVRCEQNLDP